MYDCIRDLCDICNMSKCERSVVITTLEYRLHILSIVFYVDFLCVSSATEDVLR